MVARHLVDEAIRCGIITEAEAPLYRDPPRERKPWRNDAERIEYVIAGAASGAAAITGVTLTVEDTGSGRRIPPPTNGATP